MTQPARVGVGLVAIAAALASVVAGATAHADLPPPPPDPTGYDRTGYVGLEASILPYGTFHIQTGSFGLDSDADVAYALGASFTYQLSPDLSFALAPRVLFHVESQDENEGYGNELDLRARFRAGTQVYGPLRLFAELSGGYSFVFPPAAAASRDPNGLLLGAGGGATYGVAPGTAVELLVAYQNGFQGVSKDVTVGGTTMNESATESDSFLEITVGVVTALW